MKRELRTYTFETIGPMNCLIWSPDTVTETLPCILFLHGSGERGQDAEILAMQALPKYLTAGREIPAVVVCPQCPEELEWKDVLPELEHILEDVLQSYPIDRKKVAITGISMGGFGTWYAACQWPEKFCRAAAICGAGDPTLAERVKDLPFRLYHGDADEAVEPEYSQKAFAALQQAGADVQLTLFPGVKHNSWDPAYLETDLISWLLGETTDRK